MAYLSHTMKTTPKPLPTIVVSKTGVSLKDSSIDISCYYESTKESLDKATSLIADVIQERVKTPEYIQLAIDLVYRRKDIKDLKLQTIHSLLKKISYLRDMPSDNYKMYITYLMDLHDTYSSSEPEFRDLDFLYKMLYSTWL